MLNKSSSLNVALVDPAPRKIIERHDFRDYPHLGLAYIAGYLKSKGINCSVIDAKFERINMEEIGRRLSSLAPNVVGITAMTHEIAQASNVAEVTKKILPGAVVVIGGAHATALPFQTLVQYPVFDIAVIGEGEHTFFELVIDTIDKAKDLRNIRGIAFRTTKGIQQSEPREPIKNLEDLPFPAWETLPRSEEYPVMTARGCPFRCKFCMRVMGNKLRKRTPENVVDELKICIHNYKPKRIYFVDETFTVDKAYVNRLLELLLENGIHKQIRWDCQSRPDLVDYSLLQKMKAAGCHTISFGIESGNEETLKASGKGITLNQAANAVKVTKRAGLQTDGYFIFGHPFETLKTAMDTINFATKLNTSKVTFGIMVPYPGTEIYEMAKRGEGGYKLISSEWEDFNKNIGNCLELETLSRKQLEKLQILGYIKFYLFNFRFIDGIRYFLYQRRLGWAILKKFLTRGS